jgi:hypothetical protein
MSTCADLVVYSTRSNHVRRWPWAGLVKYAVIWNTGAWLVEAYMRGLLPKWTSWHWFVMAGTVAAALAGVDIFSFHYGWALVSFLLLLWVLGPGSRLLTLSRR